MNSWIGMIFLIFGLTLQAKEIIEAISGQIWIDRESDELDELDESGNLMF